MKIFTNCNISLPDLRKLICKTSKQLGVKKVIFNKQAKYVRGTYNCTTNVLYLDLKQTKKELLNTFFHEVGHHYAVTNNLWKKYHFDLVPSMSVQGIFNVENKIDGYGKKLWNKYVKIKNWGNYKYMYPKRNKQRIINFLNKRK